ncbi:TetR family transcriptional regulator [Streptomyces abyssalis]|uniref:TetR family transcriptional regulator n=1 Tax=Streptomyces abyssalis TaxID=933944 RepID=A0A1E7JGJ5_9ACTN|nr:TetR/AcrR family transcriptional regulator [Streptomyces abyssalis]OEU85595.1 TetR family transcriptional regulator [Streptomyces abyssalis]OEU92940.1 TetR family transcriptional regulator [Streptomyces abyssalis]OEV27379.1 TetR family transcriptional regulator [Streptomyces nanshensis]
MSSSGTAPAYRRLSVDERRTQLIGAALGLFAHNPPEDVSLDDVAATAGVSRPLVYRYFPGGKQQLYEAALRSAADELEQCFAEAQTGPLTRRLVRALERYLAFVDEHDAGFMALLQGGSVVQTSRTHAIVDEVRRAAADQILFHLGFQPEYEAGRPDSNAGRPGTKAGPRLRMTVSTWITVVEAASLMWLDEGKQPPVAELRDWLLDHFVALLMASATRDAETARIVRHALDLEESDGPVGELARRMLPVVGDKGHLLEARGDL